MITGKGQDHIGWATKYRSIRPFGTPVRKQEDLEAGYTIWNDYLFDATPSGSISGSLIQTEENDTLSSISSIKLAGTVLQSEADDIYFSLSTLDIVGTVLSHFTKP